MSSILTSQGMAFATAMVVSGTVILLAIRLQKSLPAAQFSIDTIPQSQPPPVLRSCIALDGKKRQKKKKKRVKFAESVVDPSGNIDEYRRRPHSIKSSHHRRCCKASSTTEKAQDETRMPANRVALYNGILRDRVLHRATYSY